MHAKRAWHMVPPLLGACLFGYFLYHTVEGDRGWVAQMHLQNEVAAAQARLDTLQQQNAALDHRVKLMRPQSLDPDLLDEEARKTLDYTKPGDIVILTPPAPSQNTAPQ
ncbi:MAG: septum formation initiator family protein [Alphaproteobacteria bacterium]|nr:septum formation initiator family protein [Alphaproteobacteria bacterium]